MGSKTKKTLGGLANSWNVQGSNYRCSDQGAGEVGVAGTGLWQMQWGPLVAVIKDTGEIIIVEMICHGNALFC